MNNQRLDLLEAKLQVIQQELSSVLQEMQVTIQGLAKMTSAALRLFDERITALEPRREPTEQKEVRDGVDL